jgi:hypothetical protein
MRTRIWDTGPYLAVARPKAPVLGEGEVAAIEYRVQLEHYERDYRAFVPVERQFLRERAAWEKESGGGPIEIDTWQVDAGEMLGRDPRRYFAQLPAGVGPGPKVGINRKIL